MNVQARRGQYRPDIDGLRSIAVVPVILFHAQLWCPGGFVGVDLFFVISGYLITRIIQRDLEQRSFSVLKFYQRRIRRIFPALFAMLLVFSGLGLWMLPPKELEEFGKSMVAASAFCSNIFFYRHLGYFDTSSLIQPLLHTWTLSVEEQFYIFWPLMMAMLSLGSISRWKPLVVMVILTASLLLSAYWVVHLPNAAFYMLPSRAWELALGAMITIPPVSGFLERQPRRIADAASILGLALVIASVFTYSNLLPFPGFAALLPCGGAALIIAAGEGNPSLGGRILSMWPLVWIGLISYSLYLWHWPVLVFARVVMTEELTTTARLVCVAIIFLVSWISWRFIESPFRNPQIMNGKSRTWVIGGLATTTVFIAVGFVFVRTSGFSQRSPEVVRWLATEQKEADAILIKSPCLVWKDSLPPTQGCLLGAPSPASRYTVALWGDSHAAHLAPALQDIGLRLGIASRQITKAGCPPLLGIHFVPVSAANVDCPEFNDAALKALLADQDVRVVVLAARWIPLINGNMAAPAGEQAEDIESSRRVTIVSLRKTVEILTNSGRQVVVVSQVPQPDLSPVTCLARARFNHHNELFGDSMPASHSSGEEALVNQALSDAIGAMPSVQVVHPYDQLCDRHSCRLVSNSEPLFWDETHLSAAGAKLVGGSIESRIAHSLGIATTNHGTGAVGQ